jgi:hypothetical protein
VPLEAISPINQIKKTAFLRLYRRHSTFGRNHTSNIVVESNIAHFVPISHVDLAIVVSDHLVAYFSDALRDWMGSDCVERIHCPVQAIISDEPVWPIQSRQINPSFCAEVRI